MSTNMLFSPSTAQSNVSYLNNHKVFVEPTSKKLKKNPSVKNKSVSPKYENKDAHSISEEPSIKREELSYEKALELQPDDTAVQQNLARARQGLEGL